MATAQKKGARKTKVANPPEYDAFIERGRTLTESETHPMSHGLCRLRRRLNNPAKFEAFVKAGVTEFVVIADEIHSRQFREHFHTHKGVGGKVLKEPRPKPITKWVADLMKIRGVERYEGFLSIKERLDELDTEALRERLALLRDTLNNRKSRRALASIGPCALSVCLHNGARAILGPESYSIPEILVANFIPGCVPNTDYSIVPEGSRPDAPNGIWEHS